MSKIIIAVVALIIIAGAAFFYLKGSNTQGEDNNTAQNFVTTQPIICEFEEGTTHSTAYLLNGQARVDSTYDGGETASIVKGETSYHWDPATKEGFTFTLSGENKENLENMKNSFTQEDLDELITEKDNNCRNEDFDTNLLEVPQDVTFTDMSEMYNQQIENIPQEVLDQLPEEVRSHMKDM